MSTSTTSISSDKRTGSSGGAGGGGGGITMPQANAHWAKLPLFNRKNWTRVRFDEVVENLYETCDPAEAGLERVIAMEHLEPGLHRSPSFASPGQTPAAEATDPRTDLIPVCPNCHAVIHRGGKTLTPAKVRKHLRRHRSRTNSVAIVAAK